MWQKHLPSIRLTRSRACRLLGVIIVSAVAVRAACLFIRPGLRATMNITVPQYFYGHQIPHDLSMNLVLLDLFGPALCYAVIFACSIALLVVWLRGRAAT